jgi:hypothetical protein
MRKLRVLTVLGTAAAIAACLPSLASARVAPTSPTHYTTYAHIMPVGTGNVHQAGAPLGTPPLLNHGGPIMKTDKNYAIFWNPPHLQSGAASAGITAAYESLIARWFKDAGATGVYAITHQYNAGSTHPTSTSYGASFVDTSPFPTGHCSDAKTGANCITDSDIQAEVHKIATAHGFGPSSTRSFFVYTPQGEGSCIDSSNRSCAYTQYCAYHGPSVVNGAVTLYANMPFPTTPKGTGGPFCYFSKSAGVQTFPNNNINADAVINVTSHEQMESVTDPQVNVHSAWFDSSGFEIGDECAFEFGPNTLTNHGDVSGNGHVYEVQQEYSNAQGACAVVGP